MSDKGELIRTGPQPFLEACVNNEITSLRIWACTIRDYAPLANLANLTHLEILGFSAGSFSIIGRLKKLICLRLIETPRDERDLSPLSGLTNLEELSLESPPSWDSSGKRLQFATLAPMASLQNLRKLTLMKAEVEREGLRPLWGLNRLKEFHTDNTFSMGEFALLAAHAPQIKGAFLLPFHEIPYAVCAKCNRKKVQLTGVTRNGKWCTHCNPAKIAEHVRRFAACKSSVTNTGKLDCESKSSPANLRHGSTS